MNELQGAVETPVFVAGGRRRAMLVRAAVAAVAVLLTLWLASIAAGILGFSGLPLLSLPGVASDSTPSAAVSAADDKANAGAATSTASWGMAGSAVGTGPNASGPGTSRSSANAGVGGSGGATQTGSGTTQTGSGTTQTGSGATQTGSGTGSANGNGNGLGGSTTYGKPADSPGRGAPSDSVSGTGGRGKPDTTPNGKHQPGV